MSGKIPRTLRIPAQILELMETDAVRQDSNQLLRLGAELNASLALEAERASARTLAVFRWVGLLAVVLLVVAAIQFFRPADTYAYEAWEDPEYQRQIDIFNEQTRITNEQMARQDASLLRAEEQSDRYDRLLTRWEEQAKRLDAVEELLQRPRAAQGATAGTATGTASAQP